LKKGENNMPLYESTLHLLFEKIKTIKLTNASDFSNLHSLLDTLDGYIQALTDTQTISKLESLLYFGYIEKIVKNKNF
jgi:hypothetical protein